MRFRTKILAALVFTSMLPLVLLGWTSYQLSRDEMLRTIGALQTQSARELALTCTAYVADGLQALSLSVTYIPREELDSDELRAVLSIPQRQLTFVNVLVPLDLQGQALTAPVYALAQDTNAAASGRPVVDDASLAIFAQNIPWLAALQHGMASGQPYRSHDSPRIAAAVLPHPQADWVLAAELSLDVLAQRTRQMAGDGLAYIADASGQIITSSNPHLVLNAAEKQFVTQGLKNRHTLVQSLTHSDGSKWLSALVPVPELGWGIVIGQSEEEAFRGPNRLRSFTLFWAAVALILTIGLGVLLAQGLTVPLQRLLRGAQDLSQGQYDQPVPLVGDDEIGQFAKAFNHMAKEIQRRDGEIREWNITLQGRVDAATRELKDAQEQILRARRLTAMSSFSAGMAHEFNNPLTGLLGMLDILRITVAPEGEPNKQLSMAQEQAKRIADIVEKLKQFSEQEEARDGLRLELCHEVDRALGPHLPELARRNITLLREDSATPSIIGDPEQIQQIIDHLVNNAVDAMPQGGQLRIAISVLGQSAARLVLTDTGHGIPEDLRDRVFDPFFTTHSEDTHVGMGLSVCHGIIESRHGTIRIESVLGEGTSVVIVWPLASAGAHLI